MGGDKEGREYKFLTHYMRFLSNLTLAIIFAAANSACSVEANGTKIGFLDNESLIAWRDPNGNGEEISASLSLPACLIVERLQYFGEFNRRVTSYGWCK